MRQFKLVLYILSICLFSFVPGPSIAKNTPVKTAAKDITVTIKLAKIEAIKTSERSGDEVYINTTQYSNQGRSRTSRIPDAPKHWLSSQLPGVKDVIVWQDVVHENEEIKVIISVVEQDSPPWDVDDLVGSAQVVLSNHAGKLQKKWSIPIFEEKVEEEMGKNKASQQFVMKGDNSHYAVSFSVSQQ